MMRGSEIIVFDNKTFSELLSDIYNGSRQNRQEIRDLISEMSKFVLNETSVVNIAPIIGQYLEVGVKNDEQLVKIATIVQRVVTAEAYQGMAGGDAGELLTEAEKEQLIKNAATELKEAAKELEDELSSLKKE